MKMQLDMLTTPKAYPKTRHFYFASTLFASRYERLPFEVKMFFDAAK